MTPLQQIEFELLKEAIQICDRLGLTYYLVCGTALGAVKYGGFIPWDDDVDLALPREDYDRFRSAAQALLPEHCFLQNSNTDPNSPFIFSKLRDIRTTYIEQSISHMDINHGVYIDIFPIDGYPTEDREIRKFEFKLRCLKIALSSVFQLNSSMKGTTRMFLRMERVLGFHKRPRRWVDAITAHISRYPTETSRLWCNHGNWQGRLEYAPREQYGNGTWAAFEGLRVRIPERYDEYLTQKYGDWRADLPAEQQIGHHDAAVMDLDRPYTDYIRHLPHGRIRISKPEEWTP